MRTSVLEMVSTDGEIGKITQLEDLLGIHREMLHEVDPTDAQDRYVEAARVTHHLFEVWRGYPEVPLADINEAFRLVILGLRRGELQSISENATRYSAARGWINQVRMTARMADRERPPLPPVSTSWLTRVLRAIANR
jgi:hypothetical protein